LLLGKYLIDPIDLAELVQKLWVTVIEAYDLSKLGAVAPLVFYDLAPNFDHSKQEERSANGIKIFLLRSDYVAERVNAVRSHIS
jgi:hypothetical protein